jgi:DNA polymerase-1
MADYSKDANLLSCFVGVNLKSMHSFTGLGIMKELEPNTKDWSYETFIECLENKEHQFHKLAKSCRVTGKKVNFTTEYGAMAPKVAVTLLIEEEQAQKFIDAREDAFPVLKQWKEDVIVDAKSKGFVTTMMGAVRHLGDAFRSGDRWESSKAERQAVNTKVQGSAAEQTKTAESSMWRRRLPFKYDTKYIGPIHDECVWSVGIPDLQPFLVEAQACMTQKFASMSIPVESGLSFGPNFGQQIEIGFYPGNCIQKAMAELRKILGAQAKTEKVSQDYVKLKELLEKQIA